MPLADLYILYKAFIALLLGLLIGAERERTQGTDPSLRRTAGIRSFVIVTLCGFFSAFLGIFLGNWFVIISFFGICLLVMSSYIYEAFKLNRKGITSELAAITTFLIGILCFYKPNFAVILGIIMTLILSLKIHIHGFVKNLSQDEFFASLKFAIIAFIILPLLPNEALDSWGIINLYNIWLMVVFISGISFVGYILTKLIGTTYGVGITGLIGGLVSSTAVTTSMWTQSKKNKTIVFPFVIGVLAASVMMFIRVLFTISVLNYQLLEHVAWTLGLMSLTSLIAIGIFYKIPSSKNVQSESLDISSPFQFIPALKFGVFFLFILATIEITRRFFGEGALYITALISGFADVDAITISMSQLSLAGDISNDVAVRTITIAVISNTLVKAGITLLFGGKRFAKYVTICTLAVIVSGIVGIFVL
jgi:uncharacterized membrane protein (DUF4010 family)